MAEQGVGALLTADPINIFYATGVRNMTIFSMMGASRFALVSVEGPVVMWEFAGAEHVGSSPVVNEVRTAPGVTAISGPDYPAACQRFASEIRQVLDGGDRLAVERVDHPVTDALRQTGFTLTSATEVFVASRMIKLPGEVEAMMTAMGRVENAVEHMIAHLRPGLSEVEVWSHFHQSLIANGGEYVSTRLVQAAGQTFPYFNEAGDNLIVDRDLFCVDTDAISVGGYAADFSRTYLCGSGATSRQRSLHSLAEEQLANNAGLLKPGLTFAEFARQAWTVPDRHAPYGYYCLAHGLGLSGEYPYLPTGPDEGDYPLTGQFEPGMVVCLESYIGDAELGRGVKLENQYLINAGGFEQMSVLPFDQQLC